MKLRMQKSIVVVLILLLSLSSVFGAVAFTRHKLNFNVASITKFNVAIFDGSVYGANLSANYSINVDVATANKTANYATGDIEFNSSTLTSTNVDARAVGGTAPQDGTNAILRYCNAGTATITHLNVSLNSEPDACIKLFGGTAQTSKTVINSSLNVTVASALGVNSCQQWWLRANFTSCGTGAFNTDLVSLAAS